MLPSQLLPFALGLVSLIILHEFGHFLAAKLLGVEVEEFGIGFPPRILTMFKIKETEYTLNWLPFGGFVRPKGENDPNIPGGLAAASPWVRLGVLFAGPFMNLLIGAILGTILFLNLGQPIPNKVIVAGVESGTPAEAAGLQEQDLFVSINGEPVTGTDSLQKLISQNLDKETKIVVERNGQEITLNAIPRSNYPEGQGPLGIIISNPTEPTTIFQAIRQSFITIYENIKALFLLPIRLIQGSVQPEQARLLGYKGMYDLYKYVNNPLWFFMLISVSLGIVNLLPIPALDGGRILMTLPEIFINKRIPQKHQNVVNLVGFMLLLAILIYYNIQDFINPIKLP